MSQYTLWDIIVGTLKLEEQARRNGDIPGGRSYLFEPTEYDADGIVLGTVEDHALRCMYSAGRTLHTMAEEHDDDRSLHCHYAGDIANTIFWKSVFLIPEIRTNLEKRRDGRTSASVSLCRGWKVIAERERPTAALPFVPIWGKKVES